ncbi:acetyl-CoA carboxylase biotin carboxyl carrier protein [Enterococcus sp. LJL120]
MNINEVKDLLKSFDQSSLTEFDLKESSFELYMNKNDMTRGQQTTVAVTEAPLVSSQPIPVTPAAEVIGSNDGPTEMFVVESGTEIVSPIVGVVYLSPSPDQGNFKEVGDTVKKGDIICIVEAMKVMNEITSEIDGVVAEILVENEAVVEFGQPLFRIQ